jgi:hypothetical protein
VHHAQNSTHKCTHPQNTHKTHAHMFTNTHIYVSTCPPTRTHAQHPPVKRTSHKKSTMHPKLTPGRHSLAGAFTISPSPHARSRVHCSTLPACARWCACRQGVRVRLASDTTVCCPVSELGGARCRLLPLHSELRQPAVFCARLCCMASQRRARRHELAGPSRRTSARQV